MKPKKTVFYNDALNDDFAGTKINHKPLPENFKYAHKDIFSRFFSFVLYWLFAVPLLYIPMRLIYGIKIKGKRHFWGLRKQGAFYYCNHTQMVDSMLIQLYVAGPKRTYIVADQDATSIPGIRYLVQLLGCIPVPETPKQHKDFVDCIHYRIKQRRAISIFPEAHIWPYCTRIRPFSDASFVYPAELGAPVIPVCTTYRRRRIFKNAAPAMTVHVGKTIYPDKMLSLAARKKALRDQVYNFMLDMSSEDENVEYIAYRKNKDASSEPQKK